MALFRCTVCKQQFYSPVTLAGHSKSEHLGQEPSYQTLTFKCPVCGLAFGHPAAVQNHAMLWHRQYQVAPVEVIG